MPLTEFQRGVARLIAVNRNPESHMAGGKSSIGTRDCAVSEDLDIFHDLQASQGDLRIIGEHADADGSLLEKAGYSVEWVSRQAVYKAIVGKAGDYVRLDWTTDSAFRFFPVQPDKDFGYCLHMADLATNKVLALAGRSEIRDYLDILQLDSTYLSFAATVWAASGKDEGLTPEYILDLTNRHSRYQDGDIERSHLILVHPVDLKALKRQWNSAREMACELFERLSEDDIGCLYLDRNNRPVTPDPDSPEFSKLIRHRGSLGGSWPGSS